MKFAAFASLLAFALGANAATVTASVSYDETYDNASTSLDVVACSGLKTLDDFNFGSLPNFPSSAAQAHGANVLAIDHAAADTFNIALAAMNTLTDGEAVELGRVNVQATQVDKSVCKL
ncbi:Cerato-platanin [Mycena alexandri]|uniref:Cerato-platanin n=1 Tax=Mycena alexandri TaxID=1745969 RepID=A0AAD6SVT8_9AGAR|nr:Cerato-platanin [Mycena alexandri]